MRVLIVDDSDAIRRAIRRAVEKPDDEIETAQNGAEALGILDRFDPEVVTMDISMPEMGGLECISGVRHRRPSARILVISGVDDKSVAVEAVKRGAQGFLLKPFTPEDLSFELSDLFVA